jgi:hypothetical protein
LKSILLTQNLFAVVDDVDFEVLNRHKWQVQRNGRNIYAVRRVVVEGKSVALLMHREILKPPRGLVIDHLDWNGLNNTRANLRICTQQTNIRHRRMNRNNLTGYRGVRLRPEGTYRAEIHVEGKQISLGTFRTKRDAAKAYDRAAITHLGDDAQLNCT